MRWKIILTGVGLAFVAVIALAFTILMSIDFNDYRDLVQQRMKQATGRDLVIAGNIDVSFSLSPRLSAKQVSFRNAPWSDMPQMASLNEIEAEIALLPLLTGEIRIKEVVLRGGQVVVETNKEGVGNWVLDLPPSTSPAPAPSPGMSASGLPHVDRLSIQDVTLLYRDGQTGSKQTFAITRFTTDDVPDAGIKVAVKGAWNDRPMEFSGTTGAPRQFTQGPLPLDLEGKLNDVAMGLRGDIGDPTTFSNLSLDITSSGPALAALGDTFGITLPKSKPYQLALRLSGGGGKFTVSDIAAKVGSSDAAGNITVDTSGPVTGLTIALTSQRLDFGDLGLDQDGTAKSKSDGRLFSAEPWPLGWLKDVNGEITWPINTLVRGGATASDVAFSIELKDGTATLKYVKAKIEGGAVSGNGSLKPASKAPILALKMAASDVQAAPLLNMMGMEDVLTVSRVDMTMDVSGPAISLRDLMAGLNGAAGFATGQGKIRNSFARLLLGNLFGLLTPLGGDASHISCIAGHFDIKQGIASTRGTVVDMPSATVVGAGNIDLRNERIDMRVDPKSKDVSLAAIAVPIRVQGPLSGPNIIPDPVATVGNTVNFATGTVNVATLGIFGSLTGLGEGESLGNNPCATAVNNALSAKPQQSSGQKVLQGVGSAAEGVGEGVGNVLKGVGEGLGNLFGQ